ncbi:THO complex subunit 5 isoform 1 [Schistosoma japonicum]|uniref:THO complex subunit 5 isoform 1 n=1 Tax=Schistosoma japonicum TaxID=6182 RepID=A0A4Z2DAS6_SCHJA|nr:THO complex subunit 5 isoform 1 [Schistosoma japonicum]
MSSKPKSEDEVVNSENSRPINSFYDEENSVKLDGSAHDLLQFRDCCESLREFIKNTWQRKKSQEKVNASPFAFLMITIKELNRRTQFRIRKSRETTAENKNKVDQLHLSLQNLLYEVTHLENEIQTCLEFKSRHEDIKLIPLEEFYEKTGHKVGSLSEHEETLERLYWELEQRKALSDSCDKLKSAVESTSQTIRKKRNYLASFGPKLKDVAESTLIVQELMDLPFTKENEQYNLAFLLPSPLYILYSLLKSYISMSGKKSELSVSIEGDSELAKAVNQTTEQLESQSSPQEADDSDLEDGEGNKKRKKKRYATEHVDDTDKEPTNEKVNNLHPLTVLLTVSIPKNADIPLSEYDFSITLSFAWILNLNLVTVRLQFSLDKITPILRSKTGNDLLNSEQLLSNLPWSCDKRGFGDCSSDMPILLIPDSQKSITWNACESIGRPYSWAQQLSGINCFPDRLPDYKFSEQSQESTESDHFGEIESWIKSLQSRIIDRLYLIEELSEIERFNLVLSPEQQLLIPSDIELRIIRWKDSDFETLQSVPRAQVMIALNLVRSEDAIFQCHFGKNENSFVTVWVCVPPQYPHKAPLLIMDGLINYASSNDVCDSEGTVTDLSDLHIQELETEVNCYWQEFFTSSVNQNNCHIIVNDVDNINIATSDNIGNLNKPSLSSSQCIGSSKWRRNILSCQLARCASCIDALCRDQMIWKNSLKSTNNSSVRSLKYPTRSRPLRYLPSPGAFVHR